MQIACCLEAAEETRVAITPHTAKQYLALGFTVAIEKHAGKAAGFADKDYAAAGVEIVPSAKTLLQQTHILLCLQPPKLLKHLAAHALVIGHMDYAADNAFFQLPLKLKISLFSMTYIPRLSRAQAMDSVSSQANLAGYQAVLVAVQHYHRVLPMMMTAAGRIQPANVLVLGAGVAGLQAIATAKRLGAVVYAFDVRAAAKEQVESLGAKFIAVEANDTLETKDGYARETSATYKQLQTQRITQYASLADIIITTALLPDRPAPVLLDKAMVEAMKPGSVIVDLATSRGGNCALSKPDAVTQHGHVTVIGANQLARLVPTTASELYANNLLQVIKLLAPAPPEVCFNAEDAIIQQALLCHDGRLLPFKETTHA